MTAPTPEPIATRLASLVPCTGPLILRASSLMMVILSILHLAGLKSLLTVNSALRHPV